MIIEDLITEVAEAEHSLSLRKDELAKRDAEVADIFKAEKELSANVEALKLLIKDEMKREGITEWDGERATLKLTPLGKFKADDIEAVADELCDVVKKLNNKKITAYKELHGTLPDGIESVGDRLTIKIKE